MNPATPRPANRTDVVELQIPARAEWVAVARLAVAAVASRQRFSVDEIEDIKLAVAESCTNCDPARPDDGDDRDRVRSYRRQHRVRYATADKGRR